MFRCDIPSTYSSTGNDGFRVGVGVLNDDVGVEEDIPNVSKALPE
jgi:hypothetical protein